MTNLKQLGKKIEDSLPLIQEAAGNALIVAQQNALGLVTRRIFNDGLATDGSPIGEYTSEQYIKKREARGMQVDKKDFQFNGDLLQSINIVAKEDSSVDKETIVPKTGNEITKITLAITNEKSAQVSVFLEQKADNRDVFKASESEIRDSLEVGLGYLMENLKQVMQTWGK